jgi:hypothetical protein
LILAIAGFIFYAVVKKRAKTGVYSFEVEAEMDGNYDEMISTDPQDSLDAAAEPEFGTVLFGEQGIEEAAFLHF